MAKIIAILGACVLAGNPLLCGAQEAVRLSDDQVFARYALFNLFLVKNGTVQANWLGDGNAFWYAESTDSGRVFYKVDPHTGSKTPVFETAKLRQALIRHLGHEPREPGVPFRQFSWNEKEASVRFRLEEKDLVCLLASSAVSAVPPALLEEEKLRAPRFVQKGYWAEDPDVLEAPSPDGSRLLGTERFNLYLRSSREDKKAFATADGTEDVPWSVLNASWSPDGRRAVVQKADDRGLDRYPVVHWLEKPERVEWRPYTKTGRPLEKVEFHVFDPAGPKTVRIQGTGEADSYCRIIGWRPDGAEFFFSKTNRRWNRLDLMAADPNTGASRLVLSETSKTFLNWDCSSLRPHFIDQGKKFLWRSERDGWYHLYLYDVRGTLIRQLTQGGFPVLGVEGVDERRGWVYFAARAEKRIYDTHLYRVNLEGEGFRRLTESPGSHSIQMAPSRDFFLDTHSTVSRPPVTELRRADGTLVETIVRADTRELEKVGWTPPEEFVVKADDKTTDLHGVLYKPRDFDPAKKYPVIDHIYGGPAHTQVPRSFAEGAWPRALAQAGFLVMVVDNRGTPGRSRAFYDVAFKNFGQFEIPDHVAALKQLAAARPYVDAGRVGLFGGSWGGYFTLRAMLTAPDVYRAGVSYFPVADLVDHIPVAERTMGLPGDNPDGYARASNLKLAQKLQGDLLLIGGTSDINAPLTAVMKMADALIKAGKQFRMLVMPGQNHGPLEMGFDVAKDGTISLRGSAGFLYEAVRTHFQSSLLRRGTL
ncbi:MAG: S9 family peptidase [Candidatus Aminicenantes bacterium]|nr:S9 family peptidase [Candidatus Aminicenantes bacterium]